MKILVFTLLFFLTVPTVQAKKCMVGSVTDPKLYLAYTYRSQTATSFKVSCDYSYSITFNSLNLRDSNGNSFVSNGLYKLKTRMSVSGAGSNLWNVPLPQAANVDNKYVIFVQLDERPAASVPAGRYMDEIYISLTF